MKHFVTAALVASVLASTVALADPPDRGYPDRGHASQRHDDDRGHGKDYRRDDRYDGRRDYRHDDRHDARHDHRPHYRSGAPGRYHVGEYHRPHGYRHHAWHRGERLPAAYRTKVYVVNDYHVYRLRQPPRGYHWVRVNNDVVLTAIATGVVLEVVNSLFY